MKKLIPSRFVHLLLLMVVLVLLACKKQENSGLEPVPLSIEKFYPNSGKAGTLVTLLGKGFSDKLDENKVTFGGVPGQVVAIEDSKMVVRAPESGKTGTITLNNGSESRDVGLFNYQSLSISHIDPANGSSGAHIRIYGEGFSSMIDPASVTINGKIALVAVASDTLLVVEVPIEAGSGPVEVSVDGKQSRGQDFAYQAIRSIKPLTGGAGTKVRINGEGFDGLAAGNIVGFNGKSAKVLEVSTSSLLVEAPENVSTGPLTVTINGQRTTGPVFTVVPLPEINYVSPLSGPAGLEMTITGLYFSTQLDENHVLINGREVAITSVTNREIKLTLPGGTGSGKVVVIVNNQQVEGPQFRDQHLGITGFTPDNGQDGLEVTITGTGFHRSPGNNRVTFNGVLAQVLSATENTLTVRTPVNVASGMLKVMVDGQEAIGPREFRKTGVITIAKGLSAVGSMTIAPDGTVYALSGNRVLKISPQGSVTTLAGAEEAGNQNGAGTAARFNFDVASSIVMDSQHNLYVSERSNNSIRKIDASGGVTRFASLNNAGKMVMTQGNVIIAESNRNPYRISKEGTVTVISRTNLLGLFYMQFAVDSKGTIYFLDEANFYDSPNLGYLDPVNSVVMRNFWVGGGPYGSVDGMGSKASFTSINGFAGDSNSNLLVTDIYNERTLFRQISIPTRELSTIASFKRGTQDGAFYDASVGIPSLGSLTLASNGDIYFYQNEGQAIRRIFLR